jgi:hypothetical protein
MSQSTLQLFSQQTNGVTYADPLDPDMTVRFKTNSTPKVIDGHRTMNVKTEIISNDNFDITLGDSTVADALSVRLSVSGSVESQDRLKVMIENLCLNLTDEAWLGENVLVGFPPTTPPVNGEA